jgi:hypothetical protein
MPRDDPNSVEVVHPQDSGLGSGDAMGGTMVSPGDTMDASPMDTSPMDTSTVSNPDTTSEVDSTADDVTPESAPDA